MTSSTKAFHGQPEAANEQALDRQLHEAVQIKRRLIECVCSCHGAPFTWGRSIQSTARGVVMLGSI
ncbi:hypothetical protein T4D_12045 [Trichinella pseudospiralis]|uniref:Uncharacterized protein n=1 Tax=Trichinella pseudospiralis TaxID=6337 RepID=A0A0V1FYN3_TRIPS|nr:hypothetical protein T4D_12045 [Trichinella pseudospiralis]